MQLHINNEIFEYIEEFCDDSYDVENSIKYSKDILQARINQSEFAFGAFEDKIWKVFDELQGYRHTFDFEDFNDYLKFNKSIEINMLINVIKCWSCYLIETYTVPTSVQYINGLKSFIRMTNGFSTLNKEFFLDEFVSYNENIKEKIVIGSLNFFDYYSGITNDDEIVTFLYELKENLNIRNDRVRILPPSKDILVFSRIVDDYFSLELSEEEYLRWFPIWLWWNLTNIIPMRISEFCKIERSGTFEALGKCYIKLPRTKLKKAKSTIAILKNAVIPRELFIKIQEYIELSERYGETQTLISYLSIPHFNKKGRDLQGSQHDMKLIPTRFTKAIFDRLLKTFYEKIVFGKYNVQFLEKEYDIKTSHINISKKVRPGDTRHLAFINLKRQGYHPVEIARIGGHTKLISQEHYFNHVIHFVDLEILELITNTQLDNPVNRFSKQHTNTKFTMGTSFVNKYILRPTYGSVSIKLIDGYCTDINMNCKVEDCWECDAWRISKEEFVQKKSILEEKIYNSKIVLDNVIENLEKVFKGIYDNIGIDEYYSSESIEINNKLVKESKKIDKAIIKYINLMKIRERVDNNGNER